MLNVNFVFVLSACFKIAFIFFEYNLAYLIIRQQMISPPIIIIVVIKEIIVFNLIICGFRALSGAIGIDCATFCQTTLYTDFIIIFTFITTVFKTWCKGDYKERTHAQCDDSFSHICSFSTQIDCDEERYACYSKRLLEIIGLLFSMASLDDLEHLIAQSLSRPHSLPHLWMHGISLSSHS